MVVLGVGRTTWWCARATCLQCGLELAVLDVARPGRPRKFDAEAQVKALACSVPPEGLKRWTMIELESAPRREPGLGNTSR